MPPYCTVMDSHRMIRPNVHRPRHGCQLVFVMDSTIAASSRVSNRGWRCIPPTHLQYLLGQQLWLAVPGPRDSFAPVKSGGQKVSTIKSPMIPNSYHLCRACTARSFTSKGLTTANRVTFLGCVCDDSPPVGTADFNKSPERFSSRRAWR